MSYRVLVAGNAKGELCLLAEPLSLWGGLDPETGLVIDRNHPQYGASLTGRIVAMAHGRGSSSSSSVLAEALRLETAPAGFVLDEPDGILVAGVEVASRLYGSVCPILCGPLPAYAPGTWEILGGELIPTSGNSTKQGLSTLPENPKAADNGSE